MKTIITIFTFSIFLFSCSNNKTTAKKPTRDTGTSFVVYHIGKNIVSNSAVREIYGYEGFKIVNDDSSTAKKQWVQDTIYKIIEVPDTAKGPVFVTIPKDLLIYASDLIDPVAKRLGIDFQTANIDSVRKKYFDARKRAKPDSSKQTEKK